MSSVSYEEWLLAPGVEVWHSTGSVGVQRILPDGCLDLLFDGELLLVAGPDTLARVHESASPRPLTAVRLHAGRGPALLGVPADELGNRTTELADLWGARRARDLTERVAEGPSRELAVWATTGPPVDPLGDRLRALLAGGGSVAEAPTRSATAPASSTAAPFRSSVTALRTSPASYASCARSPTPIVAPTGRRRPTAPATPIRPTSPVTSGRWRESRPPHCVANEASDSSKTPPDGNTYGQDMKLTPAVIELVVEDMATSLAFYRGLGLAVPDDSDAERHVDIDLGSLHLALDTRETILSFDPSWTPPTGGHRVALAFACDTPVEVNTAYEQLVAAGAHGHLEPWDAFWGMRYAVVHDPDGTPVDLFAPLP